MNSRPSRPLRMSSSENTCDSGRVSASGVRTTGVRASISCRSAGFTGLARRPSTGRPSARARRSAAASIRASSPLSSMIAPVYFCQASSRRNWIPSMPGMLRSRIRTSKALGSSVITESAATGHSLAVTLLMPSTSSCRDSSFSINGSSSMMRMRMVSRPIRLSCRVAALSSLDCVTNRVQSLTNLAARGVAEVDLLAPCLVFQRCTAIAKRNCAHGARGRLQLVRHGGDLAAVTDHARALEIPDEALGRLEKFPQKLVDEVFVVADQAAEHVGIECPAGSIAGHLPGGGLCRTIARRRRLRQMAVYDLAESLQLHGFRDVVVQPDGLTPFRFTAQRVRGKGDHGRASDLLALRGLLPPDSFGQRVAIHNGHVQVGQDEGRSTLAPDLQGLLTVTGEFGRPAE